MNKTNQKVLNGEDGHCCSGTQMSASTHAGMQQSKHKANAKRVAIAQKEICAQLK